MGLFEPMWKNKNRTKAIAYVQSLKDTDALKEVYLEAHELGERYYEVMLAAAMRLVELDCESVLHLRTLRTLAMYVCSKITGDAHLRIIDVIDDQETLIEIAKKANFDQTALAAVRRIDDPAHLADIAKSSKYPEVSQKAIERINDQSLIADIIGNASNDEVQVNAAEKVLREAIRLNDQALLQRIACDEHSEYPMQVRAAAIGKIRNVSFMEKVILDGKQDFEVRQAALGSLYHPTTLYRIVFEWLTSERYEALFDAAIKRLRDSDSVLLIAVISQAYLWEYRMSAWKKLQGLSTVSLQKKKAIYDTLMDSVRATPKATQLVETIPLGLRDVFR